MICISTSNAYDRHCRWTSYLYHIHFVLSNHVLSASGTYEHEGFGTLGSQKGGKATFLQAAKEKTTREIVVFLFLYLNDLYSYFSATFSVPKATFSQVRCQ
jgi:hypothetical protein